MKITSHYLQTILFASIDCLVICYHFVRPKSDKMGAKYTIMRDELKL